MVKGEAGQVIEERVRVAGLLAWRASRVERHPPFPLRRSPKIPGGLNSHPLTRASLALVTAQANLCLL